MSSRSDLPERVRRRRSISAAKNSSQGVARNADLTRDDPLPELPDKRFEFTKVPIGGARVRAVGDVRSVVEAQIILLFPAVRLLADIFDPDRVNMPTTRWSGVIEIAVLEFRLRPQVLA
jgi:hypothetical protein